MLQSLEWGPGTPLEDGSSPSHPSHCPQQQPAALMPLGEQRWGPSFTEAPVKSQLTQHSASTYYVQGLLGPGLV